MHYSCEYWSDLKHINAFLLKKSTLCESGHQYLREIFSEVGSEALFNGETRGLNR